MEGNGRGSVAIIFPIKLAGVEPENGRSPVIIS
jgi:hypothetical protein